MRTAPAERLFESDQLPTGRLRHRQHPRICPDLGRCRMAGSFDSENTLNIGRLGEKQNATVPVESVIHLPSFRNSERLAIHCSGGRHQPQDALLR